MGRVPIRPPSSSPEKVAPMGEEQEAMDALLRFYNIVRGWGETPNATELAAGIHVCQGFVVQRMLHRLNPDHWSDWFGDESPPSEEKKALDGVRNYIDASIRFWRNQREEAISSESPGRQFTHAQTYIDVYQSMRKTLFGEVLQ